jgi:hypothetical protein
VVVPVMYSLVDRRKDVRAADTAPTTDNPPPGSDISRAVQAS